MNSYLALVRYALLIADRVSGPERSASWSTNL